MDDETKRELEALRADLETLRGQFNQAVEDLRADMNLAFQRIKESRHENQ